MAQLLVQLMQPGPVALVLAGSAVVACLQQGLAGTVSAFRALAPLVNARPEQDRHGARMALHRVDAVAELVGLMRADRIKTGHPFVQDALITLANARDVDHFMRWADDALTDRAERHDRAICWWNTLADTAPAMGMAGTIVGLVSMFMAMSDPAAVGPGMALALLTTLYGLILANMVAAPIANRLAQISAREIGWQRALVDRMAAIARRESLALVTATAPAPPFRRSQSRPDPREAA